MVRKKKKEEEGEVDSDLEEEEVEEKIRRLYRCPLGYVGVALVAYLVMKLFRLFLIKWKLFASSTVFILSF